MSKTIYLGWAHSTDEKGKNFGDELSPYIVSHLSKKKIFYIPVLISKYQLTKIALKRFFTFKINEFLNFSALIFGRKYLLSTGSILQFYKMGSGIVWGSGLIDRTSSVGNNIYYAVRGPHTRDILLKRGYDVPEVYGDPALLMKRIYNKNVKVSYKIGVIPHMIHYDELINNYKIGENIKIINLRTDNVEKVIDEIRSCEFIISSSLHGIIVPHAYNIPAVWVNISDEKLMGDNLKFADYFASVEIPYYEAVNFISKEITEDFISLIKENYKTQLLPKETIVNSLADNLLNNKPF